MFIEVKETDHIFKRIEAAVNLGLFTPAHGSLLVRSLSIASALVLETEYMKEHVYINRTVLLQSIPLEIFEDIRTLILSSQE